METDAWVALAVISSACLLAASTGAVFKPGPWYEGLAKPWWCPPNWLFPPAWTLLFISIAASAWYVWLAGDAATVTLPMIVFGVHLLINAAWSALFFGLKRMDLALVDVVLLWVSIAVMIALFHPIDPQAAYWLLPYLAWVSFAGVLNLAMWRLNRPVARGLA